MSFYWEENYSLIGECLISNMRIVFALKQVSGNFHWISELCGNLFWTKYFSLDLPDGPLLNSELWGHYTDQILVPSIILNYSHDLI